MSKYLLASGVFVVAFGMAAGDAFGQGDSGVEQSILQPISPARPGATESQQSHRIDEAAAQQFPSEAGAETGRTQLADSYNLLQQSLNDSWRNYLALPAEALSGNQVPDPLTIQRALRRYHKVATDRTYARMTTSPGFRETYAALHALAVELTPPPAGGVPRRGVHLRLPLGIRIDTGNGTQVRAPGVRVDTRGGTQVRAPGVRVDTRGGTRVRAPGVRVEK